MSVEAELSDGTILEFPDGTAPDVVRRTVKRQLGLAGPVKPAPAPAPTAEELAASKPARSTLTRGGQPVIQPATMPVITEPTGSVMDSFVARPQEQLANIAQSLPQTEIGNETTQREAVKTNDGQIALGTQASGPRVEIPRRRREATPAESVDAAVKLAADVERVRSAKYLTQPTIEEAAQSSLTRPLTEAEKPRASLRSLPGDIATAARQTPNAIAAGVSSFLQGGAPEDVFGSPDWKNEAIKEARYNAEQSSKSKDSQDKYVDFLGIKLNRNDVRTAPQNLAFSVVSMGASVLAGLGGSVVGALAGPVGSRVVGAAAAGGAGGAAAYRMDTNNFMRDLRQYMDKAAQGQLGRPLTDKEFIDVATAPSMHDAAKQIGLAIRSSKSGQALAQEHGLHEAGWEAIGNMIMLGAGKYIIKEALKGGILKPALGAVVGTAGEVGTEMPTQMGQHNVEVAAGMSREAPRSWTSASDWWKSFEEVAGPTILTTLAMGGMAGGGAVAARGVQRMDERLRPGAAIGRALEADIADRGMPPGAADAAARASLSLQPGTPGDLSAAMAHPGTLQEYIAERDAKAAEAAAVAAAAQPPVAPAPASAPVAEAQPPAGAPVEAPAAPAGTQADGELGTFTWIDGEVSRGTSEEGGTILKLGDQRIPVTPEDGTWGPAPEGENTPAKPVKVETAQHVDLASQGIAAAPTDAQKKAGTYQKGHIDLQGLKISLENARGSERTGIDADGERWSTVMPAAYGYIKRTEGADGDQVDVYVGDVPESQQVWIVDQIDPATGKFDEHKVMLGFTTKAHAVATYHTAFNDNSGPSRVGSVTGMSVQQFKDDFLKGHDLTKPFGYFEKRPAAPQPKEAPNAQTVRSDAGQVRQGGAEGQPGLQPGAEQGGGNLQQPSPSGTNVGRPPGGGAETVTAQRPVNEAGPPGTGGDASNQPVSQPQIGRNRFQLDRQLTALRLDHKKLVQGLPVAEDMAMNDRGASLTRLQAKIDTNQATQKEILSEIAALEPAEATAPEAKPTKAALIPTRTPSGGIEYVVQPLREGAAPETKIVPDEAPAFGESNKVFTKDAADKARELLRKKLGQVSMGLDPEIAQAGIQLAGYYIEGGARSFASYSAKMLADLGDMAKPYLKSWYAAVFYHPGMNTEGMEEPGSIKEAAAPAANVYNVGDKVIYRPMVGPSPMHATITRMTRDNDGTERIELSTGHRGIEAASDRLTRDVAAPAETKSPIGETFPLKSETNAPIGETFPLKSETNAPAAEMIAPTGSTNVPMQSTTPAPAGGMTVEKRQHTKTGADIWVVKGGARVSRSDYLTMNARAKRLGGGWSNYTKGFNFHSEAKANEFAGIKPTEQSAAPEMSEYESRAAWGDAETGQPFTAIAYRARNGIEEIPKEQRGFWAETEDGTAGYGYGKSGITSVFKDTVSVSNPLVVDDQMDAIIELFGKDSKEREGYFDAKDKGDDADRYADKVLAPAARAAGYDAIIYRQDTNLYGAPTRSIHVLGQETQNAKPDSAAMRLAERIKTEVIVGQDKINNVDLMRMAREEFGESFSPKEAYDAVEAGMNLYLRETPSLSDPTRAATAQQARIVVAKLRTATDFLPTQNVRDKEQEEYQQFSTPPAIAWLVNWVAQVRRGETALEPSGGLGGLAVFAEGAGAKVVINELSARRGAVLRDLFPDARIFTEDASQLNNVLPDDVKPTVVIMNPPFSATAGRIEGRRSNKEGLAHVDQALKRLEPGGRLVLLMGEGMALDLPGQREWWDKTRAEYNVRANIGIEGSAYMKYGTTFGVQLIVIDKTGPTTAEPVVAKDAVLGDVPALLEDLRDRPESGTTSEQPPAQPGSGEVAAGAVTQQGSNQPAGVGAVGAGERPGNQATKPGAADTGRSGTETPDVGARPAVAGAAVHPGSGRGESAGTVRSGKPTGPEGSGELAASDSVQQHGGESGLTVTSTTAAKNESDLSDSVYENYTPKRLKIEGAKPHPGKLVESAAMSAVDPPAPTYTPNLPREVITKGMLSIAQLEAVVYAGQAHSQMLPGTEGKQQRRGFFIGDGTGVGKGREIGGIILDNMRQGRKKAVWISEKQGLHLDAQRDFEGVGGNPATIFRQGATSAKNAITAKSGILFSTYSMLRSGEKKQATDKQEKGKSRIDQLVDWLGEGFDGVLVFDEAHNMANAVQQRGARGVKAPSKMAIAALNLQARLPQARVVYVSATGATEVQNLAYAARLGLWGEGTPFAGRDEFLNQIDAGGVAVMELVAQNMKALGVYMSRSLSYDGVSYDRLEHKLEPIQRELYNKLADTWQLVLRRVNQALGDTGQDKSGNAKGAAMSRFWGAHQRFFNQIITAIQMPTIIANAKAAIEAGDAVVMQLVNTNEAEQERQAARAEIEGEELEELEFGPMDSLIEFVTAGFPVQQYVEADDGNGNVISVPATDAAGNPVINRDAVASRDALIAELQSMKRTSAIPGNPIDLVIEEFGPEAVAEITGRKRRFVRIKGESGEYVMTEQKRGAAAAQNDAKAFMEDKKRVLIFSDAGGTGFSFQSDLGTKNQRLRHHYLVQPGWRADKAVQGLGRTHRTNEANQPKYLLPTTDLKAQKRFISSVARRLDQLGALTKGQRQTGSQGLFSAKDNLESQYSTAAVTTLFEDMHGGRTPLDFTDVTAQMGLDMIDPRTGALSRDKIPTVPRFLNRLLSMRMETQDQVFEEFIRRMEEAVENAIAAGHYNDGMETVRAQKVAITRVEVVHTDERSGAETKYYDLELTHPNIINKFDAVQDKIAAEEESAPPGVTRDHFFYRNEKSGKVFAIIERGQRVNAQGHPFTRGSRWGVTGLPRYVDNVEGVKSGSTGYGEREITYTKLTEAQAQEAWKKELAKAPPTYTDHLHMIAGAILPVWNRITGDNARVVRTQTEDGTRLIGRVVPIGQLKDTLRNLGVGSTVAKLPAADIFKRVMAGERGLLADGSTLVTVNLLGSKRVELKAPHGMTSAKSRQLTEQGAQIERHQWTERAFIPNGDVLERILETTPIVELGAEGGEKYSLGTGERPAANVASEVRRIAEEMFPKANLAMVDRLFGEGPAVVRSGAPSEARIEAAGKYNTGRQLMTVAMNYEDPTKTIRHEGVHALYDMGMFKEAEWTILQRESTNRWMKEHNVPDNEEGIAKAFQFYRAGGKFAGPVGRAFDRIRDFLQRIGNALRGLGYQNVDDIFKRIESGEVGAAVRPGSMADLASMTLESYAKMPLSYRMAVRDDLNAVLEKFSAAGGVAQKSAAAMFNQEQIDAASQTKWKSREKLVDMPIADFLRLAAQGESEFKRKRVQEVLDRGDKFSDLPYLLVKTEGGNVVVMGQGESHEGRHRARALQKLGYTTIPVVIKGDIRWSEQTDSKLFDYKAQWPNKLVGQSGESVPFPVMREDAAANYSKHPDVRYSLGSDLPDNIAVIQKQTGNDVLPTTRFAANPRNAFFGEPVLRELQKFATHIETQIARTAKSFSDEYHGIRKKLNKSERDTLDDVLWVGEADEVEFTEQQLREDIGWTDPKLIKAYKDFRSLVEKMGRFVDMHRRSMKFEYTERKKKVLVRMANLRVMDVAEFRSLYGRRLRLRGKVRDGDVDPATLAALDAIEEQMQIIREETDEYQDLVKEIDRIDGILAETSIRTKVGYMPHKFFGTWATYRLVEEPVLDKEGKPTMDPGTGEPVTETVHKLVAGEHGFYPNQKAAVTAAERASALAPDDQFEVRAVQFKFPNAAATTLTDASFWTFLGKFSAATSLHGQDLRDATEGIARRRFRRRIAGFTQKRTGVEGFSKAMDRVMLSHIGEVTRYVFLDKFKYRAISDMEKLKMSPFQSQDTKHPTLSKMVEAYIRDMNGQKQPMEKSVDESLDWIASRPWAKAAFVGLPASAAGASLMFGISTNPLVAAAVSGYVGWRLYSSISRDTEFKSRALTQDLLGDMAHAKLGAFFNLASGIVNLTQTPINTLPVLGPKYTMIGMQKLAGALWSRINSRGGVIRVNSDYRLLERSDTLSNDTYSEASLLYLAQHRLARWSLAFFRTTEAFNRAVTFLGAYHRAKDKGKLHGPAFAEAEATMKFTQHPYGNADNAEILRNVYLRVPFQFKKYMAQQIAYEFELGRKFTTGKSIHDSQVEIPREALLWNLMSVFLVAGTLGLPFIALLASIIKGVSDWDPLDWIKRKALEAQALGKLAAGAATVVARGLPAWAIGEDMSARAGMGEQFTPQQATDLLGPWWSTMDKARQLGELQAGFVDQLANVSPGAGKPLKAIEAMANGMPIAMSVTDTKRFYEAFADNKIDWVSPWKNRTDFDENQLSKADVARMAFGSTPTNVAMARSEVQGLAKETALEKKKTQLYLNKIISANRDYGSDEKKDKDGKTKLDYALDKIANDAEKAGVSLSEPTIKKALADAQTPRLQRAIKGAPNKMRGEASSRSESLLQQQ